MSRLLPIVPTALLALAVVAVGGALVVAAVSGGPDERPASPAPPPASGATPVASATATAAPTPAASPAPPPPDAPLSRSPRLLAGDLAGTRDALYRAIDRWRGAGAMPADVAALAFREERIYRLLGTRPGLARSVLVALPARLRGEARDNVVAHSELHLITSVHTGPAPKVALGPALPANRLRAAYLAASARFGVAPQLLAAVNFIESAFGRLRNRSVSGARGPMQFMPATWAVYGLGGSITDPHDAVMGAANYLHANGAPADDRGALYHYNPSPHYVEAIFRYARRIRADWRAYYAYYAWPVYYRGRRLTGPGR